MDNLKLFEEKGKNEEILKFKPRLQAVRQRALNVLEASGQNRASLSTTVADNRSKNKSKSINISDLMAENTIVLDSPLKTIENNEDFPENRKNQENEISFEPSEITGRSTLFKKSDLSKNKSDITIEDILASSFCDNIRRLTSNGKRSSDILSLNSLKTTDMSRVSKSDESFYPGELMASKLLRDELSWENNYLPIPSVEAMAHAAGKKGCSLDDPIDQCAKNSIDFTNISEVGNYFYKRSDQLESIINPEVLSPPKRNPPKLIGDSDTFNSFHKDDFCNVCKTNSTISSTTTYAQTATNKMCLLQNDNHSNALTMSAVENVLQQLNLNDIFNVENKLSNKINIHRKRMQQDNHISPGKENVSTLIEDSNENDTVTFTDSLLDTSCTQDTDCEHPEDCEGKNSNEISTMCAVRSAKSPSNLSHLFLDGEYSSKITSKKRSRSANRSVTQEPLSVIKSMSSTLLNEKKYGSFLDIDHKIQPPVSPIRSKSATPKKQKQPCSSPISSPRACSVLSTASSKSPMSLNTTTQSERQYLCGREDEILKLPTESKSSELQPKSPSTVHRGGVALQYTAGSLASVKSRCNSQCSTSSEFTHRNGQSLPLKATFNQCCFGGVKLRTVVKKHIGIRNISIKRLSFKIGIEGPGYQIENVENNSVIILQGQECRSFSITFCPTVLGPAIGKLNFSSPYEGWPIDKVILLQGYGGHANIKVRDFLKGPVGPPYINMGETQELSQPLVKTFSIYNRGPLSGFAVVNLNSTGLTISSLCERIEIIPKKAYIPPESIVKFRITFCPRRSDIKKILSKITEVMTIANIRIITGDDPTRQRIRNIVKMNVKNELSELTESKLSTCWSNLPNEIVLDELSCFMEQPENAQELASCFRDWEAVLTITHCFMENTRNTSNIIFPDLEETILFRTMMCASSDSNSKNSAIENEDCKFAESCTVKPNVLRFDQSEHAKRAKFTIRSFFEMEQYFEVTSNYKNLFRIHPNDGQLLRGEAIDIEVNLLHNGFSLAENVNIIVYFEKEKINIPVILERKH